MTDVIYSFDVENKIINLRDQNVILDSDVAELYGVETKRINEAVKNNPDKFPEGYLFELAEDEKIEVVENFDHLQKLRFSPNTAKAFTEKGLYMLATILKSAKAVETTFAIIETFTKVREAARTLRELPNLQENSPKSQAALQKTGDLITNLFMPEDLSTTESEASIELNLAMVKLKYSVKNSIKK